MKLIVDKIPEHPSECLFSKVDHNSKDKYLCKFREEGCPYYEEGWHKDCPFLKEETKPINYSFLTNGTHSYFNSSPYEVTCSTNTVSNLEV